MRAILLYHTVNVKHWALPFRGGNKGKKKLGHGCCFSNEAPVCGTLYLDAIATAVTLWNMPQATFTKLKECLMLQDIPSAKPANSSRILWTLLPTIVLSFVFGCWSILPMLVHWHRCYIGNGCQYMQLVFPSAWDSSTLLRHTSTWH